MDQRADGDPLRRIPHRAIVAYAVRCALRVQPLYRSPSPLPDEALAQYRALDRALAQASEFASGVEVELAERTAAHQGAADAANAAGYDHSASDAAFSAAASIAAAARALSAADSDEAAAAALDAADAAVFTAGALESPREIGESATNGAIAEAVETANAIDHARILIRLSECPHPLDDDKLDPSPSGPLGPLWPLGEPEWYTSAVAEQRAEIDRLRGLI